MDEDALRTELLAAARAVAANAYAPYSGFRVGAVVRAADGRTFAGANVENASYGLTICAERAALAAAIASGARELTHLALVCLDADEKPCLPCGACRQWIAELAPDAQILAGDVDRPYRIADLLPDSFSLKTLKT